MKITQLIFVILLMGHVSFVTAAMPEKSTDPFTIINKSDEKLDIHLRKVKDYDSATPYKNFLSLKSGEAITVQSIQILRNISDAKMLNETGKGESVFEILIHAPPHFNAHYKLSIEQMIEKRKQCYGQSKNSEITITIELIRKKNLLAADSYSIKPTFYCGKPKQEPLEQFQKMSAINRDVFTEEVNVGEEFKKDFDQLAQISNPDNPLVKKIKQVVGIALDTKFLSGTIQYSLYGASDASSSLAIRDTGYIEFYSNNFGSSQDANKTLDLYGNLRLHDAKEAQKLTEILVKAYKIHLMPQANWEAVLKVVYLLLETLHKDKELEHLIGGFKVRVTDIGPNKLTIMPIIVIYVFAGKDAAQTVLNKIYKAFQGVPGMNVPPRYNARVNDLIFIAQGNGKDKEGKFAYYFEEPSKVYYRSDFTGQQKNYHLVNPETKKEAI